MNQTLYGSSALTAVLDARDFVRRHGNSLSEVLWIVAGDRGLELYCEADRILGSLSPNPSRVGKVLEDMRDLLAEVDSPEDQYSTSLRWHGARLSDLTVALPR